MRTFCYTIMTVVSLLCSSITAHDDSNYYKNNTTTMSYNFNYNRSINTKSISYSSITKNKKRQLTIDVNNNNNYKGIRIRPNTTPTASNITTTTTTTSPSSRRSLFVITIIASDVQTTIDKQKIYDNIFSMQEFSVSSQYAACSFQKLQFQPLTGTSSTGEVIENGMGEVTIHMNVTGIDHGIVQDTVLSAVLEKYGSNIIEDFPVDHLVLCLPPGVTITSKPEWRGYAVVSHYLSVFNDVACTYVSVMIHEIGHNLGLGHSDKYYGDQSCMMGYSYALEDGPKQCFNGVKSWTLGWYSSNGHYSLKMIDILEKNSVTVDLIGIANYDLLQHNQSVIIQIENTNSIQQNNNYWIAFNRKVGINEEVQEGGDLVLITTRVKNDTSADSTLVAQLSSGEVYVFSSGSNNDDDTEIMIKVEEINMNVVNEAAAYARVKIMKYQSTKPSLSIQPTISLTPSISPKAPTHTILVITVIASDVQTTADKQKIHDKIFSLDTFSLASQYAACSFQQLQFKPLSGIKTSTGEMIENGMGEVFIDMNVTGIDNGIVRDTVVTAVLEKYGSNLVEDFEIDHLMLCLPPGTTTASTSEWLAYAVVSHYISVFNDVACTYVSVMIHEIGHNLGLGHSNKDYGDQSCMMGDAYAYEDGPKKCFNGVKSWTLGWYNITRTGQVTIDISSILQKDYNRTVDIIGIANYDLLGENQSIIIQIENRNSIIQNSNNYWIAFNRKVGINEEVQEGGDLVLITTRVKNDTSADSKLVAQLNSGEVYYLWNNTTGEDDEGGGEELMIIVDEINFNVEPAYARVVLIGRNENYQLNENYKLNENYFSTTMPPTFSLMDITHAPTLNYYEYYIPPSTTNSTTTPTTNLSSAITSPSSSFNQFDQLTETSYNSTNAYLLPTTRTVLPSSSISSHVPASRDSTIVSSTRTVSPSSSISSHVPASRDSTIISSISPTVSRMKSSSSAFKKYNNFNLCGSWIQWSLFLFPILPFL